MKQISDFCPILSQEKLVPLTYTEIHGNRLRGNDPADSFVEGYSRNHLFKGKRDAKTLDEWVVSDTATKELEPFHSLSKHIPKETCRGDASPTYPCNYMSAMKESNEVQKVNAGLIGGSLKTTTRLQRSESESRVRPFLLDTTGRVDEPLKMWSSSRYAQSQRLRNPQNRPHDRGSVLSPTSNILSGFSASSSFFNENQMRPAEGTTTRHKLPDRNSDGEAGLLRRDSDGEVETSSGDSRDRRKREVCYLHHPYRSIIDVADDDSYEAHYDRLCSSKAKARALDPGSGPVPVPMLRGKKELQRGRNSDEILAFMIQQDDNRMRSEVKKSTCQRADGGLRNDKVTLLENRILDRISGHLGTLRHSLFRSDLSRSGEVSFNEFRSAVQHCGVDMSSADLQEVFGDFVDAKLEKGSANGHAVRSHDLRHFNSVAINIERFTEHLARRIEERSGAGGTERSVEHQRARKKVLRASCKHDDPMSVFQYLNCADSGNHAEGDQDVVGVYASFICL